MLPSIIFSILGQLATGILLFIAFVPPSQIGKGFGKFHTLLALVLWMVAVGLRITPPFLAVTLLLLLAFFFSGKERIYYPLLIASIVCSFYLLAVTEKQSIAGSIFQNVAPVLVLGASAVSMLLGHWYLVAPKLSIRYLKILTIALIASLVLRLGAVIGAVLLSSRQLSAMHFYEVYGIFFLQRVLLGLILTLVLSVLTYFCVRMRSTQSATGILYVVLVFCLIGELIGAYLFQKTGVLL